MLALSSLLGQLQQQLKESSSALADQIASQLSQFSGFVEDSGEGRWTVEAAIEEAVPAEVISAALYEILQVGLLVLGREPSPGSGEATA